MLELTSETTHFVKNMLKVIQKRIIIPKEPELLYDSKKLFVRLYKLFYVYFLSVYHPHPRAEKTYKYNVGKAAAQSTLSFRQLKAIVME
jgi:hypothetical protein